MTIRLDSEASFIERYADRPKRKIGRPKGSGVLRNGTPAADITFRKRFIDAYLRGHSYKIICRDLGVSISRAGKLRRELDLPKRQSASGSSARDHEVTIKISAKLRDRMDRKCFTKGIRRTKYIVWLIERDLATY